MDRKKFILVLCSLVVLTWWGCSSRNLNRPPAGAMDSGIVGPKGEVILFYEEKGNIVVKECEDHTVLKLRSDCKLKAGTQEHSISVQDFRNSLKMALQLPVGDYSHDMKRKIKIYNQKNSTDVQGGLRRREDLKAQIARIEAFIEEFGEENANANHLSALKDDLSEVEDKLDDNAQLEQIVGEINGKIDKLIAEIMDSKKLTPYVYSTQKTHFMFNILRAVVIASPLSLKFQRVKAGSFTMGSPESEDGRWSNEGQKDVVISKDFEIMAREVTQMQWFKRMGVNPSYFKTKDDCHNHITINGEELCPSHPVERVSWNDIQSYIKKLNDADGVSGCHGTPRDASGCYRLPTEAEWELAARGKTERGEITTTRYFFGDDASLLGDYAWYGKNSGGRTHKVGSRKANSYGLHDMSGNVWEWVQDWYGKNLPGGTDPLRSPSGSSRVIRGGGWFSYARGLRSADRDIYGPGYGNLSVGFRVVRTL